MTERPERMTLNELAERFGVHRSSVAELIASGKGPGVKIGRNYLIFREAVERFERGELGFWSAAIAGGVTVAPTPTEEPELEISASDLLRAAKLLRPSHTAWRA